SYPPGVLPVLDLVKAPGELWGALSGLLAGVAIADDLDQARDLVRAHPELRVVTRDGDLLGAHWARGGAARPPSLLALRAAAEGGAADPAGGGVGRGGRGRGPGHGRPGLGTGRGRPGRHDGGGGAGPAGGGRGARLDAGGWRGGGRGFPAGSAASPGGVGRP